MEWAGLAVIVVIALGFDFTNGFHDAANAIATSVSTRALTPRLALGIAAVMNFIGALLGTGVATTVGSGIVAVPTTNSGLLVVSGAVVGGIVWNLVTWRVGLPSSSSHALIGGLVGAGIASGTTVKWLSVFENVAVPMVLSPLLGFGLAFAVMVAVLWLFRGHRPARVGHGFRVAQTASAAAMALGHGLQGDPDDDHGQHPRRPEDHGVIVLALVTAGVQENFAVPIWVILAVAVALAAGTWAGGWRIIRTLGRRIVHLDSPRGFAAEGSAAAVLYLSAFVFAVPVSTTHTITSAVIGAGSAGRRASAVRWGIAGNILAAWLLTIPGAALAAALSFWTLRALFA